MKASKPVILLPLPAVSRAADVVTVSLVFGLSQILRSLKEL